MSKYKASLFGGQNIIFTPYIDVREDSVKFRIPGIFSGDEQTVQISSITDIRISGSIISKTIEIYTSGMGIIRAEGFSPSDARSIESEIENNRNNLNKARQQAVQQQWNSDSSEVEDTFRISKKQFTDIDAIPLISLSFDPQTLFETLNTLLHYATTELGSKDYNDYNRKMVATYLDKLKQGERIMDGLDLSHNSFFVKERSVIKASIADLEFRFTKKTKKRKGGTVIKWIIGIIVLCYLWKGCAGGFKRVKRWANSSVHYGN